MGSARDSCERKVTEESDRGDGVLTMFLLFAILSGGALWDWRTGRIPNWWLAAGAVLGLAVIWLAMWRPFPAVAWIDRMGGLEHWQGGAGGAAGLSGFAAGTVGRAMVLTAQYCVSCIFFLILFFPLFLFRMMGAGDCKLLALIGGYLGIADGLQVMFYGFLTAAIWSLLYMFRKKILIKRFHYFLSYVVVTLRTGQISPYYDAGRDGTGEAFFLAPFFWCGYVFWLISRIGGR